MMRIAYRAQRFSKKDWCFRNILYMHGLGYNILELFDFFWSGGWWGYYHLKDKKKQSRGMTNDV